MTKCSFCGTSIKEGTGITFVRNTGAIVHLCSSKCVKNYLKLGRKASELKWTQEFAKQRAKQKKQRTSTKENKASKEKQ